MGYRVGPYLPEELARVGKPLRVRDFLVGPFARIEVHSLSFPNFF